MSNRSIASRKKVLRRSQLRKPSSPAPPRIARRGRSPSPTASTVVRAPERKAAEVEIGQAEMRDQFAQIAGEDALRIIFRARAACR